ncbi:ABC transporter substrate-binding protein [Corticibacter populi]|uniref:ABC transporter substrate-binding protein n=1 Tax=Corticibacter populi TaxID=1550736 RepID=A0A3M6QKK3_9BURK|nr:ABC transporter substrate-binding protein [Corticibacter populi]RMX03563.1 ABC transporter substrate-binding protein [Corticibacter populi]RZS30014.1 NitT/TauT family transport system substrate-binding protein [Corticibacter populi]
MTIRWNPLRWSALFKRNTGGHAAHHHRQRRLVVWSAAASILASGLALPGLAQAAEGKIRIAQQFGIVYLLINVAQEQQLIEKHGKAAGVDIDVEYLRLSGGAAVNDALLSGSIDIAGAGVGPLFTIWDRTKGRHNVKGVASLGNFPYYLVSINPDVKTIADFSDKDRIAVPAVTVSVQSRILQLASAKLWGDEQFNRLDKLQVQLPHPEATAALISGGTEVNAHFGNPPFSEQILANNPNAHIVLNSYEALGGPASATVLYATEKFRNESPKTYKAFVDALGEAAEFITKNPEEAADIFIRVTDSKTDRGLILQVLKNPEVTFTTTPHNTLQLGEFLHRVGAIKNKPERLTDYFFDDAHIQGGS